MTNHAHYEISCAAYVLLDRIRTIQQEQRQSGLRRLHNLPHINTIQVPQIKQYDKSILNMRV